MTDFSRREFLATTTAAAGAAALLGPRRAHAAARYTRWNATSPQGQEMLKSYATAIGNMLKLPPTDPRNWFRNAFIHTMDCPHGNWWFYPWHRGYLGWFERTLRDMSGNADFAIPYWDWTELRRIPETMFNGVLTPTDPAYNPFISSFKTFFDSMNPALAEVYKTLTKGQAADLKLRGMPTLDSLWTQVKGNPKDGQMFADTPHARYLSWQDPDLDCSTSAMCAKPIITAGLSPTTYVPFSSSKNDNHTLPPSSSTQWGILEGMPHNNVHNNIGGVNHVQPVDWGYMQDNLSPVDPIFFLHHSNIDRLWDVWTRKQEKLGLPTTPTGADRKTWEDQQFLFFVDPQGKPVTKTRCADYVTIGDFDYTYQPGSGEQVIPQQAPAGVAAGATAKARFAGKVKGTSAASVSVAAGAVDRATAGGPDGIMVAKVTLPHPRGGSAPRQFDILVNAPAGVSAVSPDSPYYAGTIAFFGGMSHGSTDVTFNVPLTKALLGLKAGKLLGGRELQITMVPHATVVAAGGPTALARALPAAQLKAVSVEIW
jgi:tyrosinase